MLTSGAALAAVLGTAAVGYLDGHRAGPAAVVGVVGCVLLAGVHRWLSLRDEQRGTARLARSEAWFRSVVGCGGDAVLTLDAELRTTWASPSIDRLLGAGAASALTGRPLLDLVHPDDVASLRAALPGGADAPAAGAGLPVVRLADDAGHWRCLEIGVCDLRNHADVGSVVLQCRDLTERLAREEALRSIAYTDPATGLANASGWLRAVQHAVDELAARPDTDRTGPAAAVLLVQLDGLAEARDRAGREGVAAVVAEIGRRLRATVRGGDLVARLGGGGFAVLAAGTPEEADRLATRCLGVVEQPIATPSGLLDLTASIGVTTVERGITADELSGRAELAVRAALAAGPGRAARYTDGLGEAAARRRRLLADLEGAMARGELSLAVQPVVSLADQQVRAFEALLRWRHPELGEVPPEELVPIAESAGLVAGLQRWVLTEATAVAAGLPAGEQPIRVSVNCSTGYLAGGTLVADVEAALRASGLGPERLVLEVTEAAVVCEEESVALDVATLRLMGVHVALDDFGTGDSALGALTRLTLDVLKLDGSLTTRIDRDQRSLALCRSIVGIAHALGLAVVAEGVETPAQLSSLIGIGCDHAQGFLLARPMQPERLAALLCEGAGQLWPGLVGSR